MITVPVHQRILGTYRHDCHCTIAHPIPQSTQSTRLLSSFVRWWDIVMHVEGANNSPSQLGQMDRGLQIVPVNGYGIKIYDKLPTDSTPGEDRHFGSLVSLACRISGQFRQDVKVAGKQYQSRECRWHLQPIAANEQFYREFLLPEETNIEISSERIIVLEEL